MTQEPSKTQQVHSKPLKILTYVEKAYLADRYQCLYQVFRLEPLRRKVRNLHHE